MDESRQGTAADRQHSRSCDDQLVDDNGVEELGKMSHFQGLNVTHATNAYVKQQREVTATHAHWHDHVTHRNGSMLRNVHYLFFQKINFHLQIHII